MIDLIDCLKDASHSIAFWCRWSNLFYRSGPRDKTANLFFELALFDSLQNYLC